MLLDQFKIRNDVEAGLFLLLEIWKDNIIFEILIIRESLPNFLNKNLSHAQHQVMGVVVVVS